MSTTDHDDAHRTAMQALGFAAQILTPHADQFAALIKAERGMHAHLHITNPTLYRDAINSEGLRQQVDLSKAALSFILAVLVKTDEEADPVWLAKSQCEIAPARGVALTRGCVATITAPQPYIEEKGLV